MAALAHPRRPRHPGRPRAAATRGATRRSPTSPSTRRSTACSTPTDRIGLRLSGGYAVEPEQSTLALVAHHPEAIYFGTTSGRLLPEGHRGRADDVIKGSPRDPSLFGELDDADPELEDAAPVSPTAA